MYVLLYSSINLALFSQLAFFKVSQLSCNHFTPSQSPRNVDIQVTANMSAKDTSVEESLALILAAIQNLSLQLQRESPLWFCALNTQRSASLASIGTTTPTTPTSDPDPGEVSGKSPDSDASATETSHPVTTLSPTQPVVVSQNLTSGGSSKASEQWYIVTMGKTPGVYQGWCGPPSLFMHQKC